MADVYFKGFIDVLTRKKVTKLPIFEHIKSIIINEKYIQIKRI